MINRFLVFMPLLVIATGIGVLFGIIRATFGNKKRYWCSTRFLRPEKRINDALPVIDLFTKRYATKEYTIYEFPVI